MPLMDNDHVVQTLAPDRPDHAFNVRILPGSPRGRQHCLDAHLLQYPLRIGSVNRITVPDDKAGRGVPRPRVAELLCGPPCGRVRRDIHVDDAASVVRQHHEHKQHAEVAVGTVKKSIEASWET